MKVLHVIPSVSPVRGGPSLAVLEMVRAMRQQGIEAEIVTTNDQGPDVMDVPLHQCIEYEQVPVRFFPRFSPNVPAIREFAISSSLTSWLWCHAQSYDVLHIHAIFSYASTVAMAIARLQGIPYIVRPLGQLCQWSLQQGAFKKQLYLNLIERANLQGSRTLHFTSVQEQQDAALLDLTTPSFVQPHGITLPAPIFNASAQLHQWLDLPSDRPVIVFLSRLHPKKGLDALISALGQVRLQQSFSLVIAGRGEPAYETEVDRLLHTAQIHTCTRRIGFVSGADKDLLLQGADLFALTSHSENFGIAVLEALAAGLPVLVTPGVALADLVTQAQLGWVSGLEPTAIATTLQQFFQDRPAAKAMGDRARHVIRTQYTWSQVVTQLSKHYQLLLKPQPLLLKSQPS